MQWQEQECNAIPDQPPQNKSISYHTQRSDSRSSIRSEISRMNIDISLCWYQHVEKIWKQLNTVCYSLRIILKYTNDETVNTVCHSTFETHTRYCIILYSNSKDITGVFFTPKKALHIMLGMNVRQSYWGKILTTYTVYCVVLFLLFPHWRLNKVKKKHP